MWFSCLIKRGEKCSIVLLTFIDFIKWGRPGTVVTLFAIFSNTSKTIFTGITNLLYYKLQSVNCWNNVFKWFYEICTGCKIDFNTVSPLLQPSQCTGTVVTHDRDGCNMSKIYIMNQSYTQNRKYYLSVMLLWLFISCF